MKVHLLNLHLSFRCKESIPVFKTISVAVLHLRRWCARVVAVSRGAAGESLTPGLVPEEAVSPNDFLPAETALVGPQPSVSLEVLG